MRLKTVTDYRMFFYLNSVHKTLAGNYAISSVFLTYIFTKNKPTTVQDSHQRISIIQSLLCFERKSPNSTEIHTTGEQITKLLHNVF